MEMSAAPSPILRNGQVEGHRHDDEHEVRPVKRGRAPRPRNSERKKVSRACDACKEKKVRCAGTQPCPRCISNNLRCHYNAEHRRGKPAPPQPGTHLIISPELSIITTISTPDSQSRDQLQDDVESRQGGVPILSRGPSQNWQGVDENRLENDYIGPTSGIAFLARSQRRFQQDFIESRSSNVEQSSQTSIFSYGDGWFPNQQADFAFPSRDEAKYLLQQYFDFAMPTYRFLHRETVETWLDNIYDTMENDDNEVPPVSQARKALIILILATAKLYNGSDMERDSAHSGVYYAAAEQLLTNETGKVTLEAVQARLSQCIYLLASSRVNQAWYIFGTTAQLIIALGLHRRQVYQSSSTNQSSISLEYRKRVFWSAYTLDRYLSVILGRPRIFRDEDIDQSQPERSEIGFDSSNKTGIRSKNTQSVDDGPIFHARLAKIIGGISTDLYPTNRADDGAWQHSAERWTSELKAWKESLPAFLNPSKVDPSMLISIFQRQSTVLSLAYAHALILANRPALLSNFADLTKRTELPQEEPSNSLKECIAAALIVVDTVTDLIEEKKMRHSFWFTHYISFCAISALYVYTIQQCLVPGQATPPKTSIFEAARKCQQSIEETTTKSSPFRKYNIILDELKKEVLQHIGPRHIETARLESSSLQQHTSNSQPSEPGNNSMSLEATGGTMLLNTLAMNSARFLSTTEDLSNGTSQILGPNPLQPQYYAPNQLTISGDQAFDTSSGSVYFPGIHGAMMGWSEFDSCALTWPDVYGGLEQGYEI
ncbi:fungal-specific transcription factor domain-containing protein [Cadophora sp. MPI-SDFR-AT-0126]|nr:fungal-specific transcription factor domain-containing protein [Leotiomycetes sp. MPI-SDFR-AT-0126]